MPGVPLPGYQGQRPFLRGDLLPGQGLQPARLRLQRGLCREEPAIEQDIYLKSKLINVKKKIMRMLKNPFSAFVVTKIVSVSFKCVLKAYSIYIN